MEPKVLHCPPKNQSQIAKVLYCPKETPKKTIFWNLQGLLATCTQKDWDITAFLVDFQNKKLGQYSIFAIKPAKVLYCPKVFLENLANRLYCPNLWGSWSPGRLAGSKRFFFVSWDSTALLLLGAKKMLYCPKKKKPIPESKSAALSVDFLRKDLI